MPNETQSMPTSASSGVAGRGLRFTIGGKITDDQSDKSAGVSVAWRYATGAQLMQLLMTGRLGAPDEELARFAQPILWFSKMADWDPLALTNPPTADPGMITKRDAHEDFGGAVRLGLPADRLRDFDEVVARPWVTRQQLPGEGVMFPRSRLRKLKGFEHKAAMGNLMIDIWNGKKWVRVQDPTAFRDSKIWLPGPLSA